jgi:hypothetical protein
VTPSATGLSSSELTRAGTYEGWGGIRKTEGQLLGGRPDVQKLVWKFNELALPQPTTEGLADATDTNDPDAAVLFSPFDGGRPFVPRHGRL